MRKDWTYQIRMPIVGYGPEIIELEVRVVSHHTRLERRRRRTWQNQQTYVLDRLLKVWKST